MLTEMFSCHPLECSSSTDRKTNKLEVCACDKVVLGGLRSYATYHLGFFQPVCLMIILEGGAEDIFQQSAVLVGDSFDRQDRLCPVDLLVQVFNLCRGGLFFFGLFRLVGLTWSRGRLS